MWYAPRCPPFYPQQGQFFQHKGCTVRLGPPQPAEGVAQGWGWASGMAVGPEWQGEQGKAAQQDPE